MTDLRTALLRATIAALSRLDPPADVLTRAEAQRAAEAASRRCNG